MMFGTGMSGFPVLYEDTGLKQNPGTCYMLNQYLLNKIVTNRVVEAE